MTASAVLEKWVGDLARRTTALFVAIEDRGAVGFIQLRADDHDGEVMSLYVDPSRWSQGVGSALLAFGEGWLATHGADTAVLWTATRSRQSRGFYEHRGWFATGDEQTQHLGPTDVVLHEVQYGKSLASR